MKIIATQISPTPNAQHPMQGKVAMMKVKGTVGDCGAGVSAFFPIPQIPFFVLGARRGGN